METPEQRARKIVDGCIQELRFGGEHTDMSQVEPVRQIALDQLRDRIAAALVEEPQQCVDCAIRHKAINSIRALPTAAPTGECLMADCHDPQEHFCFKHCVEVYSVDVCWHCHVVLAGKVRPRCEDCPDECDEENCDAPGCKQLVEHPTGEKE